jgi:hypothetical protein
MKTTSDALLQSLALRAGLATDASFYTTAEVAKLFGIHRATVASLSAAGDLKPLLLTTRRRLYAREAILRHLDRLNTPQGSTTDMGQHDVSAPIQRM